MQDIVVKVLKGGKEVETFRFRDPPKQAAQIKQELEDVGHKGVLQDNMYTYTREDVLQHGAYTLKVSEAAAGKCTAHSYGPAGGCLLVVGGTPVKGHASWMCTE